MFYVLCFILMYARKLMSVSAAIGLDILLSIHSFIVFYVFMKVCIDQ